MNLSIRTEGNRETGFIARADGYAETAQHCQCAEYAARRLATMIFEGADHWFTRLRIGHYKAETKKVPAASISQFGHEGEGGEKRNAKCEMRKVRRRPLKHGRGFRTCIVQLLEGKFQLIATELCIDLPGREKRPELFNRLKLVDGRVQGAGSREPVDRASRLPPAFALPGNLMIGRLLGVLGCRDREEVIDFIQQMRVSGWRALEAV